MEVARIRSRLDNFQPADSRPLAHYLELVNEFLELKPLKKYEIRGGTDYLFCEELLLSTTGAVDMAIALLKKMAAEEGEAYCMAEGCIRQPTSELKADDKKLRLCHSCFKGFFGME